ncbi:hypothetical protein [Leptothermofonsia sp. ETS-13]
MTTAILTKALTTSPVASSIPTGSLRQVRRLPTPCCRVFHSPSP